MSPTTITFETLLADVWSEFVNCRKRLITEGPFLDLVCGDPSDGIVLDACAGSGCESIYLCRRGFSVVANEVDERLREIASRNAATEGCTLEFSESDWRHLVLAFGKASFATVLLMGNSVGLLNDLSEVQQVLREMFDVLQDGGRLVIDQRNFDYILEERTAIVNGRFRYSGDVIYCGSRVIGKPILIRDDRVIFGYFDRENQLLGQLSMLPLRAAELYEMLVDVGFRNVKQYYDFSDTPSSVYDFVTFVATK